MEVPGSCEIRVVPAPSDLRIQNGKLAMEILHVSKSNPFEKDGGSVSDLSLNNSLRGQGMYHFSVIISIFCEFLPELEDHFEIFEHIRGFNVTIVTSANTQDETLSSWSGFFQQDGAQEY
ncbi:hypothetical protein MKW92_035698 [Papaver armeniacum]|nr:hypothetical protein MKW92_035698 [Papaver armeniacum]